MKRNLIGVLFVAGGLALSASVAASAQSSPADTAKAAIADCNKPALTAPSNLSGEAAREANAAFLEAGAALSEVTGEANFRIDELVSEAANPEDGAAGDPTELTAELAAVQLEACQAIAEIRAEYNAVLSELQNPTASSPEQEQPEVTTPEKPEVSRPEQEQPEVDRPEQDSHQTEQNHESSSND